MRSVLCGQNVDEWEKAHSPKRTAQSAQPKAHSTDMLEIITFECTGCKQRNYNSVKNKKKNPGRLELSKYCRFCRKHTVHKEIK